MSFCAAHPGEEICWECADCRAPLCSRCGAGRYEGAVRCPACLERRADVRELAQESEDRRKASGKRLKRLAFTAVVLAGAGLIYGAFEAVSAFSMARRYAADRPQAPEFSAPAIDGSTIALRALRGKIVVLDFWASWCEPCIQLVPDLKKLHERYEGTEVVVLGINFDASDSDLRKALEQYDIRWPQIRDVETGKPSVSDLYEVPEIPMTVIIDADGRVFKRWSTYDRKISYFVEYLRRRAPVPL